MQEVWKDIPGYEGAYQASSLGRVKSLGRVIEQKGRWGNIVGRTLKCKILSPGRYCDNGHVSQNCISAIKNRRTYAWM